MKTLLPGLIRSRENVLIQGEKGTGKEYLARVIHFGDECYKRGIFAKMSASLLGGCASDVSLIDNVRSTCASKNPGSHSKKKGGIPVTLYIDELYDIPEFLQRDILMLMECGKNNHRKKENINIESVRLLVGANVETEKYVSAQPLRKDIFYRLNVLKIALPPLRHRKEDIPYLIDFFLYKYCKRYGKSYFELPEKAKHVLLQYHWPGNIRELEEVVKRMILKGENDDFLKNLLPQETPIYTEQSKMWLESLGFIDEIIKARKYLNFTGNVPMKQICAEVMAEVEKKVMMSALVSTNWNRKRAASVLNISYKSMLNKIKDYGLVL
jgi:DNA-binding NtrC family response regulator